MSAIINTEYNYSISGPYSERVRAMSSWTYRVGRAPVTGRHSPTGRLNAMNLNMEPRNVFLN